jgi:hypothetical protein
MQTAPKIEKEEFAGESTFKPQKLEISSAMVGSNPALGTFIDK